MQGLGGKLFGKDLGPACAKRNRHCPTPAFRTKTLQGGLLFDLHLGGCQN